MRIQSFRSPPLAVCARQRRRAVLVTAVLIAGLSGHAWADDYLDPIGGRGGGPFEAHCPASQFLVGFELRAADDVDAIRPLCASASGPRDVSAAASEGNWYGGTGGGLTSVACTSYKPIVTGMSVAAEGATVVVNNIHLFCGLASDTQEASNSPSAVFDAPDYSGRGFLGGFSGADQGTQHCPAGQVGVGVHGRSGKWLDAIGLICGDAPRMAVAPPPPPKVKINPTSTTLKSTGAAAALASSSNASTAGPKTSGSAGSNSPASPTSIPATLPPSVPAPPPPPTAPAAPPPLSKREVRDAALQALVETVLSTINKTPSNNNNARRSDQTTMPGASQPEDSILVEVRYPMSYGYQNANSASPNSCGAFYISVLPAAGAASSELIRIDSGERMRSGDGMYVCEYLVSAMPRNTPIAVRVAMSDMRAAGSEVWLDGRQAQPPAGQRRTIVPGDRQVVLTASQPRASLRFEMGYTGTPR